MSWPVYESIDLLINKLDTPAADPRIIKALRVALNNLYEDAVYDGVPDEIRAILENDVESEE